MPPSIPVEISDLENIVREMIFIARKMMPDQISAERLVEAVLHRAISQADNNAFEGDVGDRLKILLNEEYRLRASH